MKKKKKINKPNKKISKVQVTDRFKDALKDLPFDKFQKILIFVEEEINEQSNIIKKNFDKQYTKIHEALDRNLTAAAILKTDMSLQEINEIFELGFELIIEDNEKVVKLNEEGEGNWMKVAENLALEVSKVAEDLYRNGTSKKESIEILMIEFPKLSKSMITNAYQKTIELIKEGERLLKKANDVEELITKNEEVKEESVEVKKEVKKSKKSTKDLSKEIVEEVTVEVNKQIEEVVAAPGIKILSKKIELTIQGELGLYVIENNKMTVEGAEYNSLESIENEYKKLFEHLEKSREEAVKVYSMISNFNGQTP